MKIVTVTANPCIDRSLKVDGLDIGGTNRVIEVAESINGKGINTSIAINNLGYDTVAVVIEYTNGKSISDHLSSLGIRCVPVRSRGDLRVNTKVMDTVTRKVTEFNCSGDPVEVSTEADLIDAVLSTVEKNDVLVVSGSVPPNISTDLYRRLIIEAKKAGAYTLLDADGELLTHGIKGCPDLVKPNVYELSRSCGRAVENVEDAVNEARKMISLGVGAVCVSFGAKGALFVSSSQALWADSVDVDAVGTVGAGDSMVAGFAVGFLSGISGSEAFRSAVALAAGTVSLGGTQICTSELYSKMIDRVHMTDITGS